MYSSIQSLFGWFTQNSNQSQPAAFGQVSDNPPAQSVVAEALSAQGSSSSSASGSISLATLQNGLPRNIPSPIAASIQRGHEAGVIVGDASGRLDKFRDAAIGCFSGRLLLLGDETYEQIKSRVLNPNLSSVECSRYSLDRVEHQYPKAPHQRVTESLLQEASPSTLLEAIRSAFDLSCSGAGSHMRAFLRDEAYVLLVALLQRLPREWDQLSVDNRRNVAYALIELSKPYNAVKLNYFYNCCRPTEYYQHPSCADIAGALQQLIAIEPSLEENVYIMRFINLVTSRGCTEQVDIPDGKLSGYMRLLEDTMKLIEINFSALESYESKVVATQPEFMNVPFYSYRSLTAEQKGEVDAHFKLFNSLRESFQSSVEGLYSLYHAWENPSTRPHIDDLDFQMKALARLSERSRNDVQTLDRELDN